MATLDAAGLELANDLPVEAVPAKLRCGSCNKLAVNAVKLPCCDQSICEPCSKDLPESCPICSHSPLSSDDCKPNKNLRMTVKAFIKSEEKKRSKENETTATVPMQAPAQSLSNDHGSAAQDVVRPTTESSVDSANSQHQTLGQANRERSGAGVSTSEEDEQSHQNEGDVPGSNNGVNAVHMDDGGDDEDDDDDDVVITTERPDEERHKGDETGNHAFQDDESHGQGQMPLQNQQNSGFVQNQFDFSNPDSNAAMMGFNPMMAMQNGIGMAGFPSGVPNMLGMPGMNMDPSMMFGGGGGFGNGMGMGMNDMSMMNMGMGMGMGGMGGFGTGIGGMNGFPQAGILPGQGGYNHQNYGNQMNQSFPNRGYGRPYGRGGYGRGRGNYGYNRGGRGGWQNAPNQFQGQNGQPYMQQQPHPNYAGNAEGQVDPGQNGTRRGSPSYEPMRSIDSSTDNSKALQRPASQSGDTNDAARDVTNKADADNQDQTGTTQQAGRDSLEAQDLQNGTNRNSGQQAGLEQEHAGGNGTHPVDGSESHGIDSGKSPGQTHNQNGHSEASHHHQMQGSFRGGRDDHQMRHGSAAYGYVATVSEPEIKAAAPPINAPTGPKAMRQGLPNSHLYSRPQPVLNPAATVQSQSDTKVQPGHTHETKGEPSDERSKERVDQDAVQSRSRSRSRSRQRSRRHRHRSPEAEYESDETYARRKDRERRKRKDRERRYAEEGEARADREGSKGRSRSVTPAAEYSRYREDRHASRSRRDRSRDRRRRRDRSRSPERDEANDKHGSSGRKSKTDQRSEDDDENSGHGRSKDRDRRRRHKGSSREDHQPNDKLDSYDSSKRSSRSSQNNRRASRASDRGPDADRARKPIVEQPEDEIGFKIKGGSKSNISHSLSETMPPPPTGPSSSRRQSSDRHSSTQATSTAASRDSYAAERMQREIARMQKHANLTSGRSSSLGKRSSRDDDGIDSFSPPTGPKGYSDSSSGRRGSKKARPVGYKYEDEIGDEYAEKERRRR